MAGRGAAPQGYQSRERDQVRRQGVPAGAVVLVDDGKQTGPALPEGRSWHVATLAWWENWRCSPISNAWRATDWDFALETALLRDDYVKRPSHLVAAELRQRASKMGATYEDRMRLKISIVDIEPDDGVVPPGVTAIDEYRRNLS